MKHCSEVQLVSACNCGRRQGTRRDPFDYKEANFVFYEQMTELCCFRFNRVALPENTRMLSINAGGAEIVEKFDKLQPFEDDDLSDQSEHGMESLSPGDLSLSQTKQMLPRPRRGEVSTSSTDERIPDDPESVLSDSDSSQSENSTTSIGNEPKEHVTGVIQKSSFSGMFTKTDDPRSMPRFPSWNLLDSGPYFSYTHSSGLEYNGFVRGSNFLLPWDVPLKTRINKVRKQRVKRGTY